LIKTHSPYLGQIASAFAQKQNKQARQQTIQQLNELIEQNPTRVEAYFALIATHLGAVQKSQQKLESEQAIQVAEALK